MSRAQSRDAPGPENWIAAADAIFFVGADVIGGMGVPEIAPFQTDEGARAFAARHGGRLMRLDEILAGALLGTVEIPPPTKG